MNYNKIWRKLNHFIQKMIQQNKTERASVQAGQQEQNLVDNSRLGNAINQSTTSNQQHDQSRVQIILPERKQTLEHEQQLRPVNLIESNDGVYLGLIPQIRLKQSERKLNLHDVSAVCIDLLSENENFDRKCILNSLHNSRAFNEIRKDQQIKREEKVFMEQGIQTSGELIVSRHQDCPKIEQKNSELQNESSKVELKSQPEKATEINSNQQNSKVEDIKVSTKQHITLVQVSVKEQLKIQVTTEQHIQAAKTQIKQTLVEGFEQLDQDSQIKQTAYINVLESSLPEIRNRKFTFQDMLDTEPIQQKSEEMNNKDGLEDEDVKGFLEGVEEGQYDRIIKQLREKVELLQSEFSRLREGQQQNNQEQIIQSNFISKNSSNEHQQNKPIRLSIHNTYELSIESPMKQQPIPKEPTNQLEQPSTSKQGQPSQRKFHHIKQFSSGQVSNLLVQSETDLMDLRELQVLQSSPKNKPHIQQIPAVFSSTLIQQNSSQSTPAQFQLPILLASQGNLATIKQSYQQLPYEKFRNIMLLDQIVSKISFKQKHYPSSCSTDKQLKLYGKRLLRLLLDQSVLASNYPQPNCMLNIQTDMEYYKTDQHIIYYLKSCQTFAFICYFNHTIYIGQYTTLGPLKQITRQGYGIQIRDSKYIYQGEFFADKKHGYGFVEFIGKNPFIYCGYFMDGFMDGHGKSMNQNGEIYVGDYKLGQRDGVGKLVYNQDKGVYYEGQFYDGFKHGRGFEVFENGDSYRGFYVRDKFQGEGEYKWKNQTVYKGSFVDGYKHGPGLLIFTNGKSFEKYYDHNKEINLEDDKKTIKSSRISTFSQSKLEEKTLIQQKPRNFKNARSVSGQSLLSYKSRSNQKPIKLIKDKQKIAEFLREKQMEQDLKNLDKILKDPTTDESKIRKIFSLKKLDTKDKIIGKMYNTTQRPSMKISEKGELDLFKLSKIGSQRKSLVNFDSQERLEELRDSTHNRRVQRTTNFSQF